MITKVFNWLIASLEETSGRASGKSIIAAVFSILFVISHCYVLWHKSFGWADFDPQQEKLIDSGYSVIVWLIPTLYGIKIAGKSKWMSDDNTADKT